MLCVTSNQMVNGREGKRRQQHIDDGAMNRETIDLLVATVVH